MVLMERGESNLAGKIFPIYCFGSVIRKEKGCLRIDCSDTPSILQ